MVIHRPLDLICLGRAAVDLYGEQLGAPLEDMQTFRKAVGGCAANIAVGTARLGLKSAMLTRVGDEHMGRFVRAQLQAEGVDVSRVRTDSTRLTGLVLLGIKDRETFPLIFYRENCADMAVAPGDFDEDFIASSRALLLTGTHLSRADVEKTSRTAVDFARRHGTKVVLDLDYRPVLWGLTGHGRGEDRFVAAAAVSRVLQSMLPACDLVVGTEEEIHIAGGTSVTADALRVIRGATQAPIVMKRGPKGCTSYVAGQAPQDVAGFPIDVLNVLGAGDAFMSGLLWGWIRGEPLENAARYGNAAGAMVVTRLLCSPEMPREAELRAFMASSVRRADDDPEVRRLHRIEGRVGKWPELCVLAFDHRSQLEDLAAKSGAKVDRLPALKSLLATAARKGNAHGMLIDGRYGAEALATSTGQGLWLARPVEKPRPGPTAPPLELEVEPLELRKWPREHVVKVLAFPDPSQPSLDEQMVERLLAVQRAAWETEREVLVEVIPKRGNSPVEHAAVPQVMEQLYGKGLQPDWWKLPAMPRTSLWRETAEVIARHDTACRGILILGLEAPEDELIKSFGLSAGVDAVKGFAVGRTLWAQPAAAWLSGQIDDAQLVDRVAAAFTRLVEAWRRR
ncbi:MAG: 5-dehydro-2-deoxygluconokinase [Archangiaceae bacterium]|nr:5-dehydro-2-deoxygluconokinase [Archangiaceae bacterium]